MTATSAYPETRHEVVQVVDLSNRTERERLNSDAVRAFFNIMSCWKIRDDDARRLLSSISNGAFSHPHPLGSRFNGPDRGAWYAAFDLSTSQAEVA